MTTIAATKSLKRPRRRVGPLFLLASTTTTTLTSLLPVPATAECNPCEGLSTGFVQVPKTECSEFVQCNDGAMAQRFTCQAGLIYDKIINQCNWAHSATCGPDPECPTPAPTDVPTKAPVTEPPVTASPTYSPTKEEVLINAGLKPGSPPPAPPSGTSTGGVPAWPSSNAGTSAGTAGDGTGAATATSVTPVIAAVEPTGELTPIRQPHFDAVFAHIYANKIGIANQLLSLSQRLHSIRSSSVDKSDLRNYAFMDFINALRSMAEEGYVVPKVDAAGNQFQDRNVFYLGNQASDNGAAVGLINVAVFLSQALAESIAVGSCDELNTDAVDGFLPISNSCGQYGRNYQNMYCADAERFMECAVDGGMMIRARERNGDVTPFYCGPKSVYEFTGTANYVNGREGDEVPVENRLGRTDVQGCCWWGRGTIQTRGICQYGKLNYYLGARAHQEGRPARYPNIDFCTMPQLICSEKRQDAEIEWVSGLFRWIDAVQSYDVPGWNYIRKLEEFVEDGMMDGMFIHGVSGIVTQGCHDAPCEGMASTGEELRQATERWKYFRQVAEAFGLPVRSVSRQG
eukprot:CAMPEP_0171329350 /NCGR_PEP_ID=MMETSP0878-20121228/1211_1 /TAXON_ID=67004 /ORGANISM="Thalassiosira weissflogii, Strain CCMP1336" /LENGTH=571 /DNA_ID=CAMNT_0011829321 /DNA_START=17 /DNA_END=1732 /DNA_ORIENTATION=-